MNWFRACVRIAIAALIGVVIGLLLPRPWMATKAETPPTAIALQLDLKQLVEKVAYEQGLSSAAPGGASYVNASGGLSGMHYAGQYEVKDAEKAKAVSDLLKQELQTAIESRGGKIWNRGNSDSSIDADTGMDYVERGYRLGGRAGTVHAWCARRGEYVTIVVVFYEFEDAA